MYEELDRLIVDALRNSPLPLRQLNRDCNATVARIARETNRDAFRVFDGRLQLLKRRGLICFDKGIKKWRFVEQ